MEQKKAQTGISDAPSIVLIVGLVFLVMATIAFIGEKYGDAIDTDNVAASVANESPAWLNTTTYGLAARTKQNFASPVITQIINLSNGAAVGLGNASVSAAGVVRNATTAWPYTVNISYTYTYTTETISSNVTTDLNTEIANNTSIAGIVLTISLVGIVLTILIGVFLGLNTRRI
jgi:hypothetical protein